MPLMVKELSKYNNDLIGKDSTWVLEDQWMKLHGVEVLNSSVENLVLEILPDGSSYIEPDEALHAAAAVTK